MTQPQPTAHAIDYAPPRRRPAWLTGRFAMIGVLVIAAALAGWVVVPRVWQRASLLRAQEALMSRTAFLADGTIVAETQWHGTRPAMMMMPTRLPDLAAFTDWALSQPHSLAAFHGARSAGAGERLVIVFTETMVLGADRPTEITLHTCIFEPGGWTRKPRLLHQSVIGPAPLPSIGENNWRLAVLAGTPDADSSATFQIPVRIGYEGGAEEREAIIVGHLMPDDSVRFDLPRETTPIPGRDAATRPI